MPVEHWEVVDKAPGQLQAELLRGLLEAQGIQVWLNQEGAGHAYGFSVGPMGMVEILVPSHAVQSAQQLLKEYYTGKLEGMEFEQLPPDSEEPEKPD